MQTSDYDFRPAALVDYFEANLWYHRRSELAARRFDQAVAWALQLIVEGPDRWQSIEGGYRQIRVRRFPYVLVYRSDTRPIRLVAVAHASRDQGYWRDRESNE